MKVKCFKYHGAGNDFIIIDNRSGDISLTQPQIKFLCDRRFGIGADGLMLLEDGKGRDFSMRYYNSDGYEGTMCGNGGRSITAFAARMGIKNYTFNAIDGVHTSRILSYSPVESIVELGMNEVRQILKYDTGKYFLNTGSPHLIIFTEDVENANVDGDGRYWRHHEDFQGGTNVNFVQIMKDHLFVRTFERGVEAETYACGTGVTASALAYDKFLEESGEKGPGDVAIKALGGNLSVKYQKERDAYRNILLTGPARFVFECEIEI